MQTECGKYKERLGKPEFPGSVPGGVSFTARGAHARRFRRAGPGVARRRQPGVQVRGSPESVLSDAQASRGDVMGQRGSRIWPALKGG